MNPVETARVAGHLIRSRLPRMNKYEWFDLETGQGACEISSYALVQILAALGIQAELVAGSFWDVPAPEDEDDQHALVDHCWVVVDQHVVDITATQFIPCLPTVLVDPLVGGQHQYTAVFHGELALRHVEQHWSEEGCHLGYELEIKSLVQKVVAKLGRKAA